MSRKPQPVTDAEQAIMNELWSQPNLTVRDIAEAVYGGASPSDLATVQKLLVRLEAKECVARERDYWPHVFNASIDRNEMIQRRLQTTADELCNGSLSPLLSNLMGRVRLSAKERQKLHDLIDGKVKKTPKGKK